MAKWKNSPNMDKYISKLEKLTNTREYIGEAVYDGAAVVADAMKAQIASLPVAQTFAKDGGKIGTITSVQKAGLVEGFGISKMRKDGDYYNVKLGFDGYNGQKTHKYPHGVPNSIIARSLVSGTSFRQKNDFVGRATRGAKQKAEKAMEKSLEKAFERLLW